MSGGVGRDQLLTRETGATSGGERDLECAEIIHIDYSTYKRKRVNELTSKRCSTDKADLG